MVTRWLDTQDEVQFMQSRKVSRPGLLPIWLARPVGWTIFGLLLLCGFVGDMTVAYAIVMFLGGMVP